MSLLAVPIWLAQRPTPAEPACPPTPAPSPASIEHATSASTVLGKPVSEPQGATVAAVPVPAPETPVPTAGSLAPLQKPAPASAGAHSASSSPTAPRFNLRRALAKCKPHPSARIVIEIKPGESVKIDGDRARGELGRCVESVLAAHPPHRSETIKL